MKNKIFILVIILLLIGNVLQFSLAHYKNRLFTDVIPDEQTALIVGQAILVAVYGEGIKNENLEVSFDEKNDIWIVGTELKEGYVGGPVVVYFRKCDGKVMGFYAGM